MPRSDGGRSKDPMGLESASRHGLALPRCGTRRLTMVLAVAASSRGTVLVERSGGVAQDGSKAKELGERGRVRLRRHQVSNGFQKDGVGAHRWDGSWRDSLRLGQADLGPFWGRFVGARGRRPGHGMDEGRGRGRCQGWPRSGHLERQGTPKCLAPGPASFSSCT